MPLCSRRRAGALHLRLGVRHVRIDDHLDRGATRNKLVQQFDPLGMQLGRVEAHAGNVAARPLQANAKAIYNGTGFLFQDDLGRRPRLF